jgi:glyoxylase-like metal-dependent hydrolase (beta-lactamase superfamily II)
MAVHKVTVGNVEIISLLDTPMEFPWAVFFPGKDPALFEPYRSLYPGSFGEGRFRTHASTYAIRSKGKTILCDTGVGPGPHDWLGGARGNLMNDMKAKGVSPDEVDLVVFTHLHGDHVGWNLDSAGQPTFPKAKYLVPQGDWEFFGKNLAANPQMQLVTPLREMGKMELISGERALTEEVSTLPTPGHTPGHTSLLISSAGEKAVVMGDMAHHPAQVDQIDWCSGFDNDHPQTVASRRKLFEMVESEGLVAAFCHFPEPFGKLVRLEGKRVYRAL